MSIWKRLTGASAADRPPKDDRPDSAQARDLVKEIARDIERVEHVVAQGVGQSGKTQQEQSVSDAGVVDTVQAKNSDVQPEEVPGGAVQGGAGSEACVPGVEKEQVPPPSQRAATNCVLEPGVALKGSVFLPCGYELMGRFEGLVSSPGLVRIGIDAVVEGKIESQSAVIEGEVSGEGVFCETATLASTALVSTQVLAKSLTVKKGAKLQGRLKVA